jgi:hypothetical protein
VLVSEDSPSETPWYLTNFDIYYRVADVDKGGVSILRQTEFKEFGIILTLELLNGN